MRLNRGDTNVISNDSSRNRNPLVEELKEPEGFESYEEVKAWLKAIWDIDTSYTGGHKLVRYRLKAKLKVPRPSHVKQKAGAADAFKKN
jgi:putative transposase